MAGELQRGMTAVEIHFNRDGRIKSIRKGRFPRTQYGLLQGRTPPGSNTKLRHWNARTVTEVLEAIFGWCYAAASDFVDMQNLLIFKRLEKKLITLNVSN